MDFQMKIVVQFSWKKSALVCYFFRHSFHHTNLSWHIYKHIVHVVLDHYYYLIQKKKYREIVTYSVDLGREQLQAEVLAFDCNHCPEDAHRDVQLVDHFVVEVLEDLKAVLGEVLDQEAVKNAILFNTTIIAKYVLQRTIGKVAFWYFEQYIFSDFSKKITLGIHFW